MLAEKTTKIHYGNLASENVSGAYNTVYLIPVQESKKGVPEVFVYGSVGNGCPEPAWNHRWLNVSKVPNQATSESVEKILRDHETELLAIAECYRGAQWDGSNHVGNWGNEDDDTRITYLCDTIFDAMSKALTYWDAREWFAPVSIGDIVYDDSSLDDTVSREVSLAVENEVAVLEPGDVRDWIVQSAIEWVDRNDDCEDEKDALLRSRLVAIIKEGA